MVRYTLVDALEKAQPEGRRKRKEQRSNRIESRVQSDPKPEAEKESALWLRSLKVVDGCRRAGNGGVGDAQRKLGWEVTSGPR